MAPVPELLPGLRSWRTRNPQIGQDVWSHLVGTTLIDPREPDEGWDALQATPEVVVLTSGNHLRQAAEASEHFGGLAIRVVAAGRRRLDGEGHDVATEPMADGDEVAPGVHVLGVGVLSEDETALLLTDVQGGALVIADGLIDVDGGELGFVPDSLLGDDPAAIRAGLKAAFAGLLDREWETLLLAHGRPRVRDGRAALQAAVR